MAVPSKRIHHYEIENTLFESSNEVIYAAKGHDAVAYSLHAFKNSPLEPHRETIPGVAAFKEVVTEGSVQYVVTARPEGQSLADIIATKPTIEIRFKIALAILQFIEGLHKQHLLFLDCDLGKFIWNETTETVYYLDSSGIIKGAKDGLPFKQLPRGISYCSPEQTGQVKVTIDEQSDVYLAGMILFHVFSGNFPVSPSDVVRAVHFHMAFTLPQVALTLPKISSALDQVIAKATLKHKERRYQTIYGLRSDIAQINALDEESILEGFVVAQNDYSSRLVISPKLYGRERELNLLSANLEAVLNGAFRMSMIHGQPGVGKSALISEFMRHPSVEQCVVGMGKYRQLEQNEQLKGVLQSCLQILQRKSLSGTEELKEWLLRIEDLLGANRSILAKLLPQLDALIEQKETPPEFTPAETRKLLIDALFSFIVGSATAKNPILLYLDDIQWFDQGTFDLIMKLATASDVKYVYLLCAYRSDDAGEGTDLGLLLKDLSKREISYDQFALAPIDTDNIAELVRDSLKPSIQDGEKLVKLIASKTGGNPFFVKQLLYHIYEQGILSLNEMFVWAWDEHQVMSLKAATSMIVLLENRILQLDGMTREVLLRISAFDDWATFAQIQEWTSDLKTDLAVHLTSLESENFLYKDEENRFSISHDRIREAAYGMLSGSTRVKIHNSIGQNLLSKYHHEKSHETLVQAVSQLNKGYTMDSPFENRLRLSKLNRDVSLVAQQMGAFDICAKYAADGLRALTADEQKNETTLVFELKWAAASCLLKKEEIKDCIAEFSALETYNVDPVLKAQMYLNYMQVLYAASQYDKSVSAGRKGLAVLGFTLPQKISKLKILWEILMVERLIKKIGVNNIPNIPALSNMRIKTIQDLMVYSTNSAYLIDKDLYVFFSVASFRNVLKFGGNSSSATSGMVYSMILAHKLNKFEYAEQIGMKCEELRINYGGAPWDDAGVAGFTVFTRPWLKTLEDGQALIDLTYVKAKRRGIFIWSGIALYGVHWRFHLGDPIREIIPASENRLGEVRSAGYGKVADSLIALILVMYYLTGRAVNSADLDALGIGSVSEFEARIKDPEAPNLEAWWGTSNLIKAVILDRDPAQLNKYREMAATANDRTPTSSNAYAAVLFLALSDLDLNGSNYDRKKMKFAQKKLAIWSKANPTSFGPPAALLKAAIADAEGQTSDAIHYYLLASETAELSHNYMIAAMSFERLGRMCLKTDVNGSAHQFLFKALTNYRKWNADAKVKQLQAEFASLALAEENLNAANSVAMNVDLIAVVKSCQILGSEINIDNILRHIVYLLIANAGAEKGCIILKEGEQMMVRATLEGQNPEEVVILDQRIDKADYLSPLLVDHVVRLKEPVIVDDAQTNDLLKLDPYVKSAGCKSLLAYPISSKNQLIGVVWLENNSAPGIFSDPKRIQVLEVLSSQAAISFENARLFAQEKQKIRMEGELKLAQAMQTTLFASNEGKIHDFNILGSMEPASECGGDWWHYGSFNKYDYFCIGDATGHGASAALVTSAVRSAVASMKFINDLEPAKIMKVLHHSIGETSKGKITMTMFMGVYDPEKKQFKYCNNSHEPVLLFRKSWINELKAVAARDRETAIKRFRREITMLAEITGTPLGVANESELRAIDFDLESGDCLFCYTDGIPEMRGPAEGMLGERKFFQILAESVIDSNDFTETKNKILRSLADFRGDTELNDDVTFFFAHYQPQ